MHRLWWLVFMWWPVWGYAEQQGVLADAADYMRAPLNWQGEHWAAAGAVTAATLVAYQYDEDVRDWFAEQQSDDGDRLQELGNSWGQINGLGGVTLLGLYGAGKWSGREEYVALAGGGLEAMVFSGATTVILKVAFGRTRPDDTEDKDVWFAGDRSFPSGHTTAAFALSTVLAEGVPNPGWGRRTLFYSLATLTAAARMYGENHWLSDTVMGASIGVATGLFVTHRQRQRSDQNHVWLLPNGDGVMAYWVRRF